MYTFCQESESVLSNCDINQYAKHALQQHNLNLLPIYGTMVYGSSMALFRQTRGRQDDDGNCSHYNHQPLQSTTDNRNSSTGKCLLSIVFSVKSLSANITHLHLVPSFNNNITTTESGNERRRNLAGIFERSLLQMSQRCCFGS